MEKFIIEGGKKLTGVINISGSKNSSLPILAATLLTKEKCIIRNVPNVSDIRYLIEILESLGAVTSYQSNTLTIQCHTINHEAPYDLVRKMRASVCLMGPLLGRLKKANVALPGGCVIGDRPVDLHLKGFAALGAKIDIKEGVVHIEAEQLQGNCINLRGTHGPTVLGTDNIMMAAVLAQGTTVIESAACEPEVTDLANFLNAMGAKITGIGTRTLTIEGVKELHGVDYCVIPDRIEAGTFLIAGAMLADKNGLQIDNICVEHVQICLDKLIACGHSVTINSPTSVTVAPADNPQGCSIITGPYPEFPTDMQAQFTSLLAITPGVSLVEETVFPQRFMHGAELNRMGANLQIRNNSIVIKGVVTLSGAPTMASDLRASATLVLAALFAEGKSEVHRIYHIDRGYENIDKKLAQLGAKIKRVTA